MKLVRRRETKQIIGRCMKPAADSFEDDQRRRRLLADYTPKVAWTDLAEFRSSLMGKTLHITKLVKIVGEAV